MSIVSFFLVVLLTCLLWTAACTAAAVRLKKSLPRRLLLTLGFLAPLLSIVLVGGYGFSIWMYQILVGPPSAP